MVGVERPFEARPCTKITDTNVRGGWVVVNAHLNRGHFGGMSGTFQLISGQMTVETTKKCWQRPILASNGLDNALEGCIFKISGSLPHPMSYW